MMEPPQANQRFTTREACQEYCQRWAKAHQYALVTRSTIRRADGSEYLMLLDCDRAGQPRRSNNQGARKRSTIKTGCKFRIQLRQDLGSWSVRPLVSEHNHEPLDSPRQHPILRRQEQLKFHARGEGSQLATTNFGPDENGVNMPRPAIQNKVLLNCDMGEGYGNYVIAPDKELLPYIDIANVACGFHASDPLIMQETVRNCKEHNIKIGAHPGLPDIVGFGRREIKMTPEELTAMTIYQVGALKGFLDREDVPLNHVKPHGALYGMMCRDYEVAAAVMRGIPPGVPVFGLAGTKMEKAAYDLNIEFWAEMYADKKYSPDSMLVIDREKLNWTTDEIKAKVQQLLETQSVVSTNGDTVTIDVRDYPVSICCHSDTPGCLDIIKATKEVIDAFNAKS